MADRYEGKIADLAEHHKANAILFRLAEALGETIVDGTIYADPDELLERTLLCLNSMAPFQIGHPDPTPDHDPHGRPQCGMQDPDGAALCTWPIEHPASWSHVAGNGDEIVAVF